MEFINKTILIISPEAWGISFVSKHHYAQELAKKGNKVYFLNPPSDKNELLKISDNLHVINYKNIFRGSNKLPIFLKNIVHKWQIKRIYKLIKLDKIDIIWSFDPFRFQNLNLWQATKKIYHSVDIHATDLEYEIANSADLVLANTDNILTKLKNINRPKYKINHGLAAHFLQEIGDNFELAGRPARIKVGYVGNLFMQAIDKNSCLELIKNNPNIDFYFIGANKSAENNLSTRQSSDFITELDTQNNVILLGAKPSAELPAIMQNFDLFLFCYQDNPPIIDNPHKILEYLSTGKTIVATYIDEYKDKTNLLQMCKKNSELLALFQKTVENLDYYNSNETQTLRKNYAIENTYSNQIKKIESLL